MIRTILRGRFGTVLASLFAVCCLLGLGGPQATAAPSSDPPPASLSWTADLHRQGPAEVNIRHQNGVTVSDLAFHPAGDADRRGYALTELAVHETGRPVRTVHAEAKASVPAGAEVAVEVRGRQSGRWTEWRQAVGGTATLPAPASAVQARLVLRAAPGGARPVVTGLRLTATAAPSATQQRAGVQAAAAALTYRVYATREGLVGETTANGHVIRPRDHFVALPSRRALSPNGSGQYSVRVCNPANGRCETAPVWDVGPWNTHDDYWNPSSTRERFRDLPQGTPEAQAAYLNGYNGGRDEFGRRVANPAGIDLADGTFWDGLGMTNNGWVNVTYLWTGGSQSWPTVRQGAQGERVKTVQYLLNHHGAHLVVDGDFGSGTLAAVQAFQSSHGLDPDGVVGSQTWPKLIVTLRQGSNGEAVKALQSQLTAHGHPTTVDGDFGSGTLNSVRAFQAAAGLSVDGVVGPMTWQALVA